MGVGRVAAGAPSPMADARASLDAGSRELLRAHWPALDGAWAAEPFADGGRLTAALLERATEHIGLLDKRVKLRLLLAAGCLRPAAVAPLTRELAAFVRAAGADSDSWVRTLAALIGKQTGAAPEAGAVDPAVEALVGRLATRAAESGVAALLAPHEAGFLADAPASAAAPHFKVEGSESRVWEQQKAAAEACRLPAVAWEQESAAGSAAKAAAPRKRQPPREGAAASGGGGGIFTSHTARTAEAKRRRRAGQQPAAAAADPAGGMRVKDDASFLQLEKAKAAKEQAAKAKAEATKAAYRKKQEEREAARKAEVRRRRNQAGDDSGPAAHGLRGAAAALPAWLLNVSDPTSGEPLDAQGFVYKCKYPQLGDVVYYMDRRKRHPFYTDMEVGGAALMKLSLTNEVLLDLNMERLQAQAGGDSQSLRALTDKGKQIYADKPTLARTRGTENEATWSQEEYGQPGLQREYLLLKSLQRFTETWALLERAAVLGLFAPEFARDKAIEDSGDDEDSDDDEEEDDDEVPVRAVSVGGGPGYELFAMHQFFGRYAANIEVQLCSLDLEQSWDEYVDRLLPPGCALGDGGGSRFRQWDVNVGSLFDRIGGAKVDYVVISYVLEMYMTTDYCCDMMAGWLKDGGVRAVIISSRGKQLEAKAMMEARGVSAVHLLSQEAGRDERQTLFLLPQTLEQMKAQTAGAVLPGQFQLDQAEMKKRWGRYDSSSVFPNVPHEEDKQKPEAPAVEAAAAAPQEQTVPVAAEGQEDTDPPASDSPAAPASPTYQYTPSSPTYTPASPEPYASANSPIYAPASPGFAPDLSGE